MLIAVVEKEFVPEAAMSQDRKDRKDLATLYDLMLLTLEVTASLSGSEFTRKRVDVKRLQLRYEIGHHLAQKRAFREPLPVYDVRRVALGSPRDERNIRLRIQCFGHPGSSISAISSCPASRSCLMTS